MIDPAVETLPFEDVQLDLGHIQSTAVLGDIVKLEPITVRLGFIWRKELIEAVGIVRVELINHHPDGFRIRVVVVCEFNYPVNPLRGTFPLGDFDVYLAS